MMGLSAPSLSAPIWALLGLTPLMIASGQVLFKLTGDRLARSGDPFYTVLYNPVFILALAIYGIATLLWIYVLKTVPLAYAYSFMALTFVIVPLMAALWLGETLTLKYALGAVFIIIGLFIVQT
ncbi:MAG: EamA family transporter [Alphaproteobacteria bacterium]